MKLAAISRLVLLPLTLLFAFSPQLRAQATGSTTIVTASVSGEYVYVTISASYAIDCDTSGDDGGSSVTVGDLGTGNPNDGGDDEFSLGPFGPGTYPVSGSYSGFYSEGCSVTGSSASTNPAIVAGPQPSLVTVTAPTSPVREGQPLPLAVVVTGNMGYLEGPNPTGKVVLFYQDMILDTLTLAPLNSNDESGYPISSSATITLSTAGVTPGTYQIGFSYGGDTNLTGSSNGVTVTIDPTVLPTTTSLALSPTTVTIGQSETLTAKVAPNVSGTVPTGTVNFYYEATNIGQAMLNSSGVGTLTESTAGLPPGKYALTAKYRGDSYNAASTSAAETVLLQAPTTTTVTANPATLTPGQSITLTANAARTGLSGTPTGTVDFSFEGYNFATATLNAQGTASATLATQNLGSGSYQITATYNGDTLDVTSTSAPVTITVQ